MIFVLNGPSNTFLEWIYKYLQDQYNFQVLIWTVLYFINQFLLPFPTFWRIYI